MLRSFKVFIEYPIFLVFPLVHCIKSVQVQSFSGLYFPVFGLNTEIYGENLRIQYKYRKIRTRKKSVFGHISHSGTSGKYKSNYFQTKRNFYIEQLNLLQFLGSKNIINPRFVVVAIPSYLLHCTFLLVSSYILFKVKTFPF